MFLRSASNLKEYTLQHIKKYSSGQYLDTPLLGVVCCETCRRQTTERLRNRELEMRLPLRSAANPVVSGSIPDATKFSE
jgi:hypothetical protein